MLCVLDTVIGKHVLLFQQWIILIWWCLSDDGDHFRHYYLWSNTQNTTSFSNAPVIWFIQYRLSSAIRCASIGAMASLYEPVSNLVELVYDVESRLIHAQGHCCATCLSQSTSHRRECLVVPYDVHLRLFCSLEPSINSGSCFLDTML